MAEEKRFPSNYSDGSGMIPLKPIDLKESKNCGDILKAMEFCSFGGRNLGEAAAVLEAMIKDKNCFRVLTLSGAMTAAQMGLIICDLIESWFDCVVSTGAIMAHGLIQGLGKTHYKVPQGASDSELYAIGANRIYDTIELEKNMDSAEEIMNEIFKESNKKKKILWSSQTICREIGRYLVENMPPESRGILKSAYLKNVPIFIPAFTDSELGLDFAIQRYQQHLEKKPLFQFSPFPDLEGYTSLIENSVRCGKKLGIFIIGGGVPRNWAQQVGPHLDVRKSRLGEEHGVLARFTYAVRICTASENEGGFSGCRFSEGISWGKFVPPEEGGKFSEVVADATIILPFLVRGLIERTGVL